MPPKKTIQEYVTEIRTLHKQIKKFPEPKTDKQKEELKTLKKQLDTQLRGWIKRLDITIFVAQNEQYPWMPEEFKEFVLTPMRPYDAKKWPYYQVGDYQAYFSGGGVSGWIPVLVERKGGKEGRSGPHDLYGTLINPERCDTFYREIERFRADARFSMMIVIAECTLSEYLLYTPLFNGKKRNVNHIGASPESRGGKIDSLYNRGVPVLFAGTRILAVTRYKGLLKGWLRLNYACILKLDIEPYDDRAELLKKKAAIEEKRALIDAEYQAVCGALGVSA